MASQNSMERIFSAVDYSRQNYAHRITIACLLNEFHAKISGLRAPARVLDAGCGTGNITQMLRQFAPIKEVYGIDVSSDMIKFAQENITRFDPQLKFHQCNIEDFGEYPKEVIGSCDIVTCFNMLHWMKTPEIFLANVARCLRPNSNSFGIFNFMTDENQACNADDPKYSKLLQLYDSDLVKQYCADNICEEFLMLNDQIKRTPQYFEDIAQRTGLNVDLIEDRRFLSPFRTEEVRLLFEMMFKTILVQMSKNEQDVLFAMGCEILNAKPTDEIIWMSYDTTIMVLSLRKD